MIFKKTPKKDAPVKDGLYNFFNKLANSRNALNTNRFANVGRLSYEEMSAIYKTGIMSKVIRLKSGYALDDTLIFDSEESQEYFDRNLSIFVQQATKFMLVYGRGVILVQKKGADLSHPVTGITWDNVILSVFSPIEVSVTSVNKDLQSGRIYEPESYNIRGVNVHPKNIIDFTYVKPTFDELPTYDYGGISEIELCHAQIIADGIIERSSATIIEKSSNFFYKITGFGEALQSNRESQIVDMIATLENARSIYGAGIIDANDSVEVLAQSLSNLKEIQENSLRRIALVTGVPLPILVGENANGLNASGNLEQNAWQFTIESLQSDYLINPIRILCDRLGLGEVSFKENQGQTALQRIEYEQKAIQNAATLFQIGEDAAKYLENAEVLLPDNDDSFFPEMGVSENEDAD
jgi:hypothetical protein